MELCECNGRGVYPRPKHSDGVDGLDFCSECDGVGYRHIDPFEPCPDVRGSSLRVAFMAARYRAGLPLYNSRDCQAQQEAPFVPRPWWDDEDVDDDEPPPRARYTTQNVDGKAFGSWTVLERCGNRGYVLARCNLCDKTHRILLRSIKQRESNGCMSCFRAARKSKWHKAGPNRDV